MAAPARAFATPPLGRALTTMADDPAELPTCRICRSEEEPGMPLDHPCRCTGSIRYCHQEWCVARADTALTQPGPVAAALAEKAL